MNWRLATGTWRRRTVGTRASIPLNLALTVAVALAATVLAPHAESASATSARLILPVTTAKPGEQFLAGVELTMKPGWHTYWKNGGDSGAPTSLEWTLPDGLSAGDVLWPAPERHIEAGFVTFVHHLNVTLLVPIQVAPDAAPGPRTLTAKVRWLECEKLCVPGQGTVSAPLTIGPASSPSSHADLIRAAQDRLPASLPPDTAEAAWEGPPSGDERTLILRWRTGPPAAGALHDFFPASGDGFEIAAATQMTPPSDGRVILKKSVRKFGPHWPTRAEGVFAMLNPKGLPLQAWNASVPILDASGSAPPPNTPIDSAGASPSPAPAVAGRDPQPAGTTPAAAPTPSASATRISLTRAILLGLLGGLILNVMPCVLPVIALKILGFVRQSGSRPAEVRKLGIVYTIGVWFSFLVLAAIVIGVKQTAGIAGWGMQFGNPVFLIAMTTLVLLVSLSLFGVFEINLTGRALDKAGELTHREGPAGAFFNGMLATILATPCTAPFLAPALGYAFAESASTIVIVFSAVALGLASPYLLLSWQPAWLRFLPKPGPWMERFKVAMGFPMIAATLWLYSLAATRHFPEKGALWIGLFLVGVALAAWIWGEFVQRGRRHVPVAIVVAVLTAASAYGYALEKELRWRSPRSLASSSGLAEDAIFTVPPVVGDEIRWQAWSRDRVAAARRLDRPVLVDFTADYCLTCLRNERVAINVPEARKKLLEVNAIPLKGDHTLYPPEISEELQRFGRAGVPLVLVYPRDPSREPEVLPEWLSPEEVISALDRAARSP